MQGVGQCAGRLRETEVLWAEVTDLGIQARDLLHLRPVLGVQVLLQILHTRRQRSDGRGDLSGHLRIGFEILGPLRQHARGGLGPTEPLKVARPRQCASEEEAEGSGEDDRHDEGDDDTSCGESVHRSSVSDGTDMGIRAPPRRQLDWDTVALTIGIVGLPNVGKSTMFNALTKNQVLAANYLFATIEPNVGVVPLPDARLTRLAEIFSSEKILNATVDFVDIAGIVRGASEGEGLGNQFLANIREADAICQVIRGFVDDDVVHVDGKISPGDDIDTINTELILADLQTLEKARPRSEKEVKGKRAPAEQLSAIDAATEILESGKTLYQAMQADNFDVSALRELQLMTVKPFLYVFNVDDEVLADEDRKAEMRALVAPVEAIFLDAKFESELAELDEDEAREMLESTGQEESGLDQLARVGFDTLGLQTYLTAGPKESRAWTIPKGATAPEAAGVIHTDFQKGFIKAEVVSFDALDANGSMAAAKAAGKVRMEGKDYVMADGDVVEFRFAL